MTSPLEESVELRTTFQSPHFQKDLFFEWIKTLGTVVKERRTERQMLKLPKTLHDGIPFIYYAPYTGGGKVTFDFRDAGEQSKMLPTLRSFLKKASACVACRCCETECTKGAITVKNGKLKVDSTKCTKCGNCYVIDNSCWRYFSMRVPEETKSKMVKIHSYKTFGLQEVYLSALMELREKFLPWFDGHPLGSDMVPAARNWFKEANLTTGGNVTPTTLLDVFDKFGSGYPVGWEFIWMALVNNSVLVKWFVTSTDIDIIYTTEKMDGDLRTSYPELKDSVINGGLQSLKNMLKFSPLGGEGAVTLVEKKGNQVKSITRKMKDVHPLTLLYGLYLIADKAERGNFTVRELLTADVESMFVSPLIAFGIASVTFKKQCEGLRTKYPDYISTTFTHGNDGLEVFPQKHSLEDIIVLVLEA
jgi:ferredoxin